LDPFVGLRFFLVFFARIFFFYPNIGTQLGLTHVFHSSSILSHLWLVEVAGRDWGGTGMETEEEVEWRQGKDGNDDLSPSSLYIFCLSGSGKNLQEENQFTNIGTKNIFLPTENYFFLSAQCISTVGIQNPPSKVNVTIPDPKQIY
jgi:hypothetical protein